MHLERRQIAHPRCRNFHDTIVVGPNVAKDHELRACAPACNVAAGFCCGLGGAGGASNHHRWEELFGTGFEFVTCDA